MQMQWWYGRGCIAVVTEDDTIILSETAMNHGVCGGLAVIQRTINELLVLNGNGGETKSINTGIQVRGLSVAPTCFLVWSGKVGKVYRMDSSNQKYESLEQIKTSGTSMVIADSSTIIDEAIFLTEGNSVKILNFTGTQKGIISFSESEGNPVQLDLHGKFLAVATSKGYIKVYDVHTPTKPRQLSGNGVFNEYKSKETIETVDTLILKSVKINSSGTIIGVLCDKVANQNLYFPDSRLFVFDRTKGSITHFDFAAFKRYPKNLIWDEFDDRLLICESIKFRETEHMQKKVEEPNSETVESSSTVSDKDAIEIFTFFVTSEHGILMQDSAAQDTVDSTLIGLSAPNIFYKKSFSIGAAFDESSLSEVVFTRKMRDFVGIDRVTDNVKSSLLDFSFFLTLGKLDEAYRVVKEIDSPMIWENMAQMCVKTKRLDVAEVCLGNMGHARGAAAVRESKRENNLEVSIGVLAIQLGLLDDAARMFKEANRHDLLNQLYQAAGLWGKAIEVAESNDRIHLKTTHYQYAKYLENLSKIDEAIEHFQVADTARTEVPRLLFQLGRIEELNEYVMHSDDSSLSKWWASYLESIDRLDKAKRYYAKAKDYLSLVRIYCFQGDFQKAVDIITESNDRASAYHFARQMENQGEFQEAIRFYALSGCYNHSIRLARAYNLDSELMRFAVKSTQALMIECAQHFETKSEFDKAIQLYHKGGDIPRALELCFRIGEDPKHPHAAVAFDLLNAIAQDLGVESSPQTLARCADFLVQHQQYNKAIELYVMAKRYLAAIEMCTIQRVSLTEEMVESLTPPEDLDSVERKDILKSLAKALKKQGAFTLASKKYTQAGDRVRAIKCLVRGGDTKAVIQFANISRNNEIYTLAANYLQQMDWRENVEIMKAIITFYTRAKAFVQLAGFYEGCAQVEIDEYRDYEKALGALNEAIKCLSKDNSRTAIDMLKSLEKRILIIEKFIEAKFAKNNPNLTVTICEALLQDPLVEEAIRLGDCLALLIETFHQKGNFPEAYHYLQELQERFNSVQTYLDNKLIRDLEQKMGIKQVERERMNERSSRNESTHHGESKGDIEDEIEEEIDEVSFLSRLEVTIFSILQDLGGGYEGKSQHADRKRW